MAELQNVMEDQDFETPRRKLIDGDLGSEDTSWKVKINGFFLNEAYGSFFLNMIADVVVRCMCAFFLPLLGFCLAFGCCRRAKKGKLEFSKRQLQQLSDVLEDREKAFWLTNSNFCKLLEAASQDAAQGNNSTSMSGHGMEGHGLAKPNRDGDNTVISEVISHTPKLNGYMEIQTQQTPQISSSSMDIDASPMSENLEKGPVKPDVRKRLNGFKIKHMQTDEGKFMKQGVILLGERTATAEKLSVEPQPGVASEGGSGVGRCAHEHVILDIPVFAVLPSSASLESGDALKKFAMVKFCIRFIQDMCSSRILQASVKPTEENLRALRALAVEGMKIDKEFTLQIDRFYMYYCKGNPEEPVLLSLRDVEVPTLLQAEYVAGVLTIRGRSLEGAEIRAATSDEYLILHPEKQEEESVTKQSLHGKEIEEWRCTNLLLPVKLDKVHVFASKKVCIQGEYVTVRSEASPMVDNTLSTVMRQWIPTAILVLFASSHVLSLLAAVLNFTLVLQFPQLWLQHLAPALVIYILQILPSSMESNVKSFMNGLKFFFAIFKLTPLLESTFTKRNIAPIHGNSSICSCIHAKHIDTICTYHNVSNKIEKNETMEFNQNQEKKSPIDLDWQWLSLKQKFSRTLYDWVTEPVNSTKEQYQTSQPFEVIYRPFINDKKRHRIEMNDKRPSDIIVKIYSKGLQSVLKKLITRHLRVYEDYAEIQAKYVFLVYLQGALDKNLALHIITSNNTSTMEEKTTQLHVFHLIRFIEREFEITIIEYQRMITEGVVSWDMLWTLFQEKEKVVYYCELSKEELCGKVISWQYRDEVYNNTIQPTFEVQLEAWDYDCINYEPKNVKRKIHQFFQDRVISNLDIYSIKLQTNVAKTDEFFLNRGKMYHKLVLKTERHYMHYNGIMFWSFGIDKFNARHFDKMYSVHRESVDGRVMIDQGSYAKMKSKRDMGTAQAAKGWLQGSLEKNKNLPSENDPNLQFAPTIVYGFSFSLRKWGCFLIPQLHEITFTPTAFDTLVMKEEQTKRMLLALTKQYIKHPTLNSTTKKKVVTVDPLPNKGKGCIILLHGPPGTGKTLTVESLAEKMECPLWQLTVSTLNMKPKKLETRLLKKFEIAALWGAIMLLDEADVYLTSRKYSPLATDASQGNAVTGVFLRILEYYKGILFLTTNQIDSFEEAIYSRISLFVKYEGFNSEQRYQLWSNFMNRVGILNATPAFWKEVLPIQLNGRVIRNIVSNAEVLCESQGKQLHEDHILNALRMISLATTRGLLTTEEKIEERDGQDSMSIVPSCITHDHWSLSDIQSI